MATNAPQESSAVAVAEPTLLGILLSNSRWYHNLTQRFKDYPALVKGLDFATRSLTLKTVESGIGVAGEQMHKIKNILITLASVNRILKIFQESQVKILVEVCCNRETHSLGFLNNLLKFHEAKTKEKQSASKANTLWKVISKWGFHRTRPLETVLDITAKQEAGESLQVPLKFTFQVPNTPIECQVEFLANPNGITFDGNYIVDLMSSKNDSIANFHWNSEIQVLLKKHIATALQKRLVPRALNIRLCITAPFSMKAQAEEFVRNLWKRSAHQGEMTDILVFDYDCCQTRIPKPDLLSPMIPVEPWNAITDFLDDFIASKDFLQPGGCTWKAVMMLNGEPGVGKSSVIKAIAAKYDLPLYNTTLSTLMKLKSEGSLDVQQSSHGLTLLVVEELEEQLITTITEKGLNASVLYNLLDGARALEGVILVFTANNLDNVRHRYAPLLRSGRIDLFVDFPATVPTENVARIIDYELSAVDKSVRDNLFAYLSTEPHPLAEVAAACKTAKDAFFRRSTRGKLDEKGLEYLNANIRKALDDDRKARTKKGPEPGQKDTKPPL